MDTLGYIEVLVRIAWLLGAVAFVIGLARMNSPATARNGNLVSAGGMILAIGATAVLILSRELLGPEWLARWERSAAKFPADVAEEARTAFAERIRGHAQFAIG